MCARVCVRVRVGVRIALICVYNYSCAFAYVALRASCVWSVTSCALSHIREVCVTMGRTCDTLNVCVHMHMYHMACAGRRESCNRGGEQEGLL